MSSKKKFLLSVFANEPEQIAVLVSCSGVWLSLHDLPWSEARAWPVLRPVTITWDRKTVHNADMLASNYPCAVPYYPTLSEKIASWSQRLAILISGHTICHFQLYFGYINQVSIYSCKMPWCSQIIDIAGLEIWFEIVKETNACKNDECVPNISLLLFLNINKQPWSVNCPKIMREILNDVNVCIRLIVPVKTLQVSLLMFADSLSSGHHLSLRSNHQVIKENQQS